MTDKIDIKALAPLAILGASVLLRVGLELGRVMCTAVSGMWGDDD